MQPCPTADPVSTLYRWAPYCYHSGFQLAKHQADNMTCSFYTDLVNCITLVTNYNGFNCSVDDIIMMYQQNTSMFDLTDLNHTACTVPPLELRDTMKHSVCADEVVRDYVFKYGCRNFSKENIKYVTTTNFCRKVASTTDCIQTMMASFGATCSREEAGRMLKRIPRLEYLGCVDECHKNYKPDYKSSCSAYSPLTQELSLCSDKADMIRGSSSQYDQCSTYWPMLVRCIQKRLYEGGAVCDGYGIVGRLRNDSKLLTEKRLESLYNCHELKFPSVCEEKDVITMAVDACNVDMKKCGQEEMVTQCVQSQLGNKTYPVYCSWSQLRSNVLFVLGERGHRQCSEGDLRLNGSRFEILKDGRWEGFCYGQNWTDSAAGVVCRQLGYKYGLADRGYRSDSVPISMSVTCKGDEERFSECHVEKIKAYCEGEAHVRCLEERTHLEITGNRSGWVVAVRGGKVGLICDQYGWGDSEASVACRSLGFASGEIFQDGAPRPLPHASAFQASLNCKGNENSLDSCLQSATWQGDLVDVSGLNQNYYYGPCYMYNMATAYCHDKLRLHRKYGNSTGIVLMKNATSTYAISNDGFDDKAASVVCRQLGFEKGGISLGFNPFSSYYTIHSLANLTCNGDEADLMECEHNGTYYSYSSTPPAVVKCTTDQEEVPDMEMKVSNDGRVMVSRYGIFGTICNDGWTNKEAETVCSTMGYDAGYAKRLYGQGSEVPKWLYNVTCADGDKSLLECNSSKMTGSYSCYYDAGVYCFNRSEVPTYSLTNGHYGYVMATLKNEKGIACSNYLSSSKALVICRSLGYYTGEPYTDPLAIPETTTAWYASSMYCSGDEASLDVCMQANWTKQDISGKQNSSDMYYTSNCRNNLFRVFCYGRVRLHTKFFNKTGVLQVASSEVKESYRTFCADNFTDAAAQVACQELGLAKSGIVLPAGTYGNMYASIGWDNVTCDGTESSILNCSKPSSSYSCYTSYASILCDDKPDTEAPITEIKVSEDGRVLVKRHGYWGTVCGSGWTETDANVVCQALGYDAGFNQTKYRSQSDPQWLGQVNCTGSEKSLTDCKAGDGKCWSSSKVAAVKCYNTSDLAKYTFHPQAGSPNTGFVMVNFMGLSYPLCDWQYVSEQDVNTLCRYFGFPAGKKVDAQHHNQSSYDYAWATDFDCSSEDQDPNACSGNWTVSSTDYYRRCYSNLVKLSCAKEVSLYPDSSSSGPLVVYFGKSSYKVCAENFTNIAADVACREMGFKGGSMISSVAYKHPSYSYGMTDVNCTGTERSIKECSSRTHPEYIYCSSQQFVSLKCYHGDGPDGSNGTTGGDMAVKLRGINNVVVIQKDNIWFSLCGNNWSDKEASVVCRNMGYKEGLASQSHASSDMPISKYRFNCTGSESSLSGCSYWTSPPDQRICYQSAVATCLNKRIGFSIQGGIDAKSGWVLAVDGDQSGLICDYDGWSDEDAAKVCQSQGYTSGEKLPAPPEKKPTDSILMATFQCSGSETDINACSRKQPNQTYFFFRSENYTACNSWTVATASCYGRVRLQPFFNSSLGVVLISDNKESYSICTEGFDDKAANVVCQEVGFPNGGSTLGYNPFIHSSYSMGFGSVTCSGSEKALESCVMSEKYNYKCPSGVPAVVKCDTGKDEVTDWKIRTEENKVLVSRFGVFGEVCSDGFNDVAAVLVCKSLGFDSGAPRKVYSSAAHLPVWMFNVSCSETDTDLKSCSHDDRVHSGSYCNNVAGVFCHNKGDLTTYSIEGGKTKNYGYLIGEYKGLKATVCSPIWSSTSANVVCKELGFAAGQAYYGETDKPGIQDVIAGHIDCDRRATLLDMCRTKDWEIFKVGDNSSANYSCSQGPVKVFCYPELRLHTGFFNKTGIVQVPVDNEWSAVCSDGFDDKAASVVCRQLGLSSSGVAEQLAFNGYYAGMFSRGNVSCTGTESSLLICSKEISRYACASGRPATVVCTDSTDASIKVIGHDKRGLVKVTKYGINGTVCSSGWDDVDASVYCTEQGYEAGFNNSQYSYGDQPQWISSVECTGSEKSLLDCPFATNVYTDNCERDATVFCYNKGDLAQYTLTKQPEGQAQVGQVEATRNGATYPVCAPGYFANTDASIMCRSLDEGFVGGQRYDGNMTMSGSADTYWSVSMTCSGQEKLADICITDWSIISSKENRSCQPAQVECYREVRLYPNSLDSVGTLVVRNDNGWSAVCMDGFTETSAMVACIEMGYAGGTVLTSSYPAAGYSKSLKNVRCTGSEKSLKHCPEK
ncbi:scavenger receptor cysteine-rich type 1 protein M160-like [Haliotis rubra]|uniref:scavenger receptor cysteine-rich type 1 protein M160-like n=1 Tax=Haliotis rubra TaxID=36100 RepID=UPI001EE63038|nr:scavenger receptor cysteine-rich type 1 protein M160-like [Haliotis rubra]